VRPVKRNQEDAARIEANVATLARGQHGVVARRQLLEAGVTDAMLEVRLRAQRLRRLHRGVYLVGPLQPPRAAEMAAVLAGGAGTHVSHTHAAALHRLLPPVGPPIHVTVQGVDCGRIAGLRPHRVVRLTPEETGEVDGIPATSPARTLVDIANVVSRRHLEQAVAAAEEQRRVDPQRLAAYAAGMAARHGARRLLEVLQAGQEPALTDSEAEEVLLAIVRGGGLPEPRLNVMVGGFRVDFYWPEAGVVLEVDGFAVHGLPRRFEGDRRRDLRLAAVGLQVVRVTWSQITKEPGEVLALLAQVLARGAERGNRRAGRR
jgi:very-short-patch-repair endonuclease/predicted transcriptional regulator of viral defense system